MEKHNTEIPHYTMKDVITGFIWSFYLNNLVFLFTVVLQAFGITHLSSGVMMTFTICTTLLLVIPICVLTISARHTHSKKD